MCQLDLEVPGGGSSIITVFSVWLRAAWLLKLQASRPLTTILTTLIYTLIISGDHSDLGIWLPHCSTCCSLVPATGQSLSSQLLPVQFQFT